jgi:putative tryptophan/tyrosine transport system substrate-binding protein
MNRRAFIAGLGGAAAWPLVARSQQPMPVVGYVGIGSPESYGTDRVGAVRKGLSETGYVDGDNVTIESRSAQGFEDLPSVATELIERGAKVMTGVSLLAKASTTIPMALTFPSDPVEAGFVASLNRPGNNITGVYMRTYSLGAKRLELLREAVPKAAVIAVMANPSNPSPASTAATKEIESVARALGQQIIILNVSSKVELDPAFAMMVQQGAGALLVMADVVLNALRSEIVVLATRHAIPAIYEWREFAVIGGLMSYGTDITDAFQRVGIYAGKILNGVLPAELPIDQAARVELVLNLKTAKALNLTLPLSLLGRADEVIE